MDINTAKEYLARRISPGETCEDLLRFPRYLEIETIHGSNARCPMCTIQDWQRDTRRMEETLFDKIASEVIEHADEIKRVTLYRDGEPLLDKRMPDRIARLKEGGIRSVSISTNASLLTETTARDLLDADLDIIIMSIDSLKKEVYEGIRVGLTFEQVLDNVLRFVELRDRMHAKTQIWMRMIRQESNRDEWPEYRDFWASRLSESDRVYYHNIFNWGGQLKDFNPIATSYEPNLPCVALWSLMVIFTNGEVPLCNVDFNNMFPSGDLVSHSIADIWRSEVMNERRWLHLSGQKERIDLCENCNVWDESPDLDGVSSEYAEDVEIEAV